MTHIEPPYTPPLLPLFTFADSSLKSGHSVLLHCVSGSRKSGALAVILLSRYLSLSVDEALAVVKKCRHVVEVSGALKAVVKGWEEEREKGGGGRSIYK